jgi:hypothetical protein
MYANLIEKYAVSLVSEKHDLIIIFELTSSQTNALKHSIQGKQIAEQKLWIPFFAIYKAGGEPMPYW